MLWTTLRLMPLFAILSLSNCTSARSIDSYCALYKPLIVKKGDAAPLTKLPWEQKATILGNEQIYRETCK
jgi:hypothetical protein